MRYSITKGYCARKKFYARFHARNRHAQTLLSHTRPGSKQAENPVTTRLAPGTPTARRRVKFPVPIPMEIFANVASNTTAEGLGVEYKPRELTQHANCA